MEDFMSEPTICQHCGSSTTVGELTWLDGEVMCPACYQSKKQKVKLETKTKAERSKDLRWRKPALAGLNYYEMTDKLDEIQEACGDIHWAYDDDETLINALDGDEEEAWEFKMAFSELEAEAYQLSEKFFEVFRNYSDMEDIDHDFEKAFNDCSVALIGNTFNAVGYDGVQEDYLNLTGYQQGLAFTESGKRIMKLTKKEMLSQIGQTLGIILAFQNVELKYEYLKATIDIFRDENTSILKQIKSVEQAYKLADEVGFEEWDERTKDFDRLVAQLPDKIWIA